MSARPRRRRPRYPSLRWRYQVRHVTQQPAGCQPWCLAHYQDGELAECRRHVGAVGPVTVDVVAVRTPEGGVAPSIEIGSEGDVLTPAETVQLTALLLDAVDLLDRGALR